MITDFKLISEDGKNLFDQGGERYVIPLYQRAFAWGMERYSNRENEIIQLMDDVIDVQSGDDYYLGSLVVFKRDEQNVYEVIDGQQRLTALYLLFSCLGIRIEKERALSYDCRPKSDYALSEIAELMNDASILAPPYDNGIYLGVKTIQRKIETETRLAADYTEKLKAALKRVHLFRIEVPNCTDLNRYFEIMNTRGEQLEQNDIVKALLMSKLKPSGESSEREIFAEVWNACSDMNGYVQMHFNPNRRDILFGSGWNENPSENRLLIGRTQSPKKQQGITIQDVIKDDYNIDIADNFTDNDERIRFESIIDFRHFLLHVLKVFLASKRIVSINGKERLIDELLDDKKLIWSFERVLKYGVVGDKIISPHDFAWNFMICLLRCRFLFDKYIIKREFREENSDGEWSLQEMKTSGARSQKKAYYVQTGFDGYYERRTEFRTQCNKMLQACFRVSYTSPKNMHWITELLKWLYNNSDGSIIRNPGNYFEIAKEIASIAVRPFVLGSNHQLGVNTPHIVFNFLDFLLWEQNHEEPFEFEFRNSVEHWYPQHPTENQDGCPPWNPNDGHGTVDRFGNLALLPPNINSRFSNQSPMGKKGYESVITKGSLKLRKMAERTISSEQWRICDCQEHEEEMLRILKKGTRKMIYDYTITTGKGEELKLADLKGKVILIVNTATGCGFTPQYTPIEKLYLDYHDKGLEILDIPCNQFGGQAPGTDDEIHEFCTVHFNTTFPRMKKSDVNGPNELPLYTYLKSQKGFAGFEEHKYKALLEEMFAKADPEWYKKPDIKWNFTKFVVDRNGNVVARFEPTADMAKVEECIKSLL